MCLFLFSLAHLPTAFKGQPLVQEELQPLKVSGRRAFVARMSFFLESHVLKCPSSAAPEENARIHQAARFEMAPDA
jgi:hypothetical protein